jgi:hypothetical protein
MSDKATIQQLEKQLEELKEAVLQLPIWWPHLKHSSSGKRVIKLLDQISRPVVRPANANPSTDMTPRVCGVGHGQTGGKPGGEA